MNTERYKRKSIFLTNNRAPEEWANRRIGWAALVSNPKSRLKMVRRLYEIRFAEELDPSLTLQQIRGMEGRRVRSAYAQWSELTGVPWNGRNYNRDDWDQSEGRIRRSAPAEIEST